MDCCGYVPRVMGASCDTLNHGVGRYLFISSISVYAEPTPSGSREDAPRAKLADPATEVIDGVDALMDAESGDYKRLPLGVDVGFAYVSGTYTGESLSRVRGADGRPQDTNDSAADFELRAAPAPREAR